MCHLSAHRAVIWVALGIFLLVPGLVGSSVATYKLTDKVTREKITCNKCPPGTYVAKHCTAQSATECQTCPDQHYTQYWNYLEECRFCNVFCEGQSSVKHECNATLNRVCECPPGYYRASQMCMKHTKCRPGYGVSQKGTPETDTQCVRCSPGTFSSVTSTTYTCQPHTNCTEIGQIVNVPGTAKHNTRCTKCVNPEDEAKEDCYEAALEDAVFNILSKHKLRRYSRFLKGKVLRLKKVVNRKTLRAFLKCLPSSKNQNMLKKLRREESKEGKVHPHGVRQRILS